jgi:hypothetical protein
LSLFSESAARTATAYCRVPMALLKISQVEITDSALHMSFGQNLLIWLTGVVAQIIFDGGDLQPQNGILVASTIQGAQMCLTACQLHNGGSGLLWNGGNSQGFNLSLKAPRWLQSQIMPHSPEPDLSKCQLTAAHLGNCVLSIPGVAYHPSRRSSPFECGPGFSPSPTCPDSDRARVG